MLRFDLDGQCQSVTKVALHEWLTEVPTVKSDRVASTDVPVDVDLEEAEADGQLVPVESTSSDSWHSTVEKLRKLFSASIRSVFSFSKRWLLCKFSR